MFMAQPLRVGGHYRLRRTKLARPVIATPLPAMVLRKGRALANLAASDTSLGGRSVKTSKACTLLLAVLLAGSAAADESTMKELTPTGKLRVALVFAPSKSAFFVVKDASGKPRGVTVDLADALAKTLSVAPAYVFDPNSGLATDAAESGAV